MSTDNNSSNHNNEDDDRTMDQSSDKSTSQNKENYKNANQSKEELRDTTHQMNERTDGIIIPERSPSSEKVNKELMRQWKNIETAFRKRYPIITDEDVDLKSGDFEDLINRIGKRINKSRTEVVEEIMGMAENRDDTKVN